MISKPDCKTTGSHSHEKSVGTQPFMRVYGARGSHPAAGTPYAGFGGDTSCVATFLTDKIVVFDAGTGLISLGKDILTEQIQTQPIYIFLSHLHFDHVMGLPFFAPVYRHEARIKIFLPKQMSTHFWALWKQPYCPVDMANAPSAIELIGLENDQTVPIETDIVVQSRLFGPDVHPKDGVTVYRLHTPFTDVVYATDIELHKETALGAMADFARGAQYMFCDAQYLPGDDYEKHCGWGHNNLHQALAVASMAGIDHLYLFHHDPARDDIALNRLLDLVAAHRQNVTLSRQGSEIPL